MPADLLAGRLCPPRDLPLHVSAVASTRSAPAGAALDPPDQPVQRTWTAEQISAIERRHGDLLLDAAAGSGKTSVLVERFARLVLEDGLPVSGILAITFTEKAAAELRDRIRARLRALGAADAARQTETAAISTIHGFCARLVRGHALAAGLDPRFEVLGESRSGPLAAAAFEAALGDLAASAGSRRVAELIAAYRLPALRAGIRAVHARLRSAGQERPRLPQLTPDAGTYTVAALALRDAAGRALAELGAVATPGASVQAALERLPGAVEIADRGDVWPGELGALELRGGGKALSTDACGAYREALAAFRRAAADRAAGPVRDLLDGLLAGYAERYAAAKTEVAGIDFEDLELLARRLLAQDASLRTRIAERYGAIMVDELQDTNRVQLELVELIARGNLFTVGDAQQSIYLFRHADVELFRTRGRRLQAVGARETLQTNFRTCAEIVDVLNGGFAAAMGEAFRPLRAGRGPAGGDGARVELLVADKGAAWEQGDEGLAAPWRRAEAAALAGRVAEIVAGGTPPGDVVVLMRATTDMRAYERALEDRGLPTYVIGGRGYWDHPQVLDMVAYLRVLANPQDEEALLAVLASPLVGVSLDALVLLAAAARESGRGLWRTLRDGADDVDGVAGADLVRWRRFVDWFIAERARARRAGIEELIEGAMLASGYDLAVLALPGGPRRLANVRKLMRLGREHEAQDGPDLRSFLDELADRRSGRTGGDREAEAPVEGEGLDAIRLMTIHRAKGLEFPVVCVADLGRSARGGAEIVLVGDGDRLGLRLARPGGAERESALAYGELRAENEAAEADEERRLFYVAMTRARERLVLSGAAKLRCWADGETRGAGGGPINWIAPAFAGDLAALVVADGGEVPCGAGRMSVGLVVPAEDADEQPDVDGPPVVGEQPDADEEPAPPVPPALTGPPTSAPASAPASAPPTRAARPPVATLSYSALADHARCGYRFYAERVLGLPPVAEAADDGALEPAPAGAPPTRDAADHGVLVHALLERFDPRRPVLPASELARAAAARAGMVPPPGPAELDALVGVVRRFAATPLADRLARALDLRREQRFAFPLDDAAGPLVVGALDVLAREPSGRTLIVDYKTDRLLGRDPGAVVAERYAGQQLIYGLAALSARVVDVEVAHVFLEAPEEPVSSVYPAEALPELRAQLRRRAADLLARRFAVAPDPHRRLCAGCPARGGLCSWPEAMTLRESAETLF